MSRAGIHVLDSVIAQRFADFGGGPWVGQIATEGDFARAGCLWAIEKCPSVEAKRPNHVPAFQRSCLKWLADIRDADPDWDGDNASR